MLRDLLPIGALGAARAILPDDDRHLRPAEAMGLDKAVRSVKCASGAARHLARDLLQHFGGESADIIKTASGAPIWPPGLVGSLAHDAEIAAAIVGAAKNFGGLGIDVEAPEHRHEDLWREVASPSERLAFGDRELGALLVFCIKEAVFKAVNPRDGIFLEFADVTLDAARQSAATRYGRNVRWRAASHPRPLAVAWW